MKSHLSANDYYSEEETVIGQWQGKAAQMLGIEGEAVTAEAFEALRTNRHPLTGDKLRPRIGKGAVAYHDIVVSCPKTMSIAALVGGDERVTEAFKESVKKAFERLEAYAERRYRKGAAYNTEKTITTGNGVAAVYHHDTSRLLDPQLHAHCVFSNHTRCEAEGPGQWYALQPRAMMEESKATIRQVFYRDMARECKRLGYDVEWKYNAKAGYHVPRLSKISPEIELLFSQRAQQKVDFIGRYQKMFGQRPDERRVEYFIKETKGPATKRFIGEYEQALGRKPSGDTIKSFVKDWRSSKMAHSSREQVLSGQLVRMSPEQSHSLRKAVTHAILRRQAMAAQAAKPQQEQSASIHDAESIQQPPKMQLAEPVKASQPPQRQPVEGKNKVGHKRRETARMETLRKLKRGGAILRALNGHPASFIARELTRAAKKRKQP